MKHVLTLCALYATSFGAHAELPSSGFRAVQGGASPDGRWLVCVLDSSGVEFVDELPGPNHSAYLVDLGKMAVAAKIPQAETLGSYHGWPETNVKAKWFPDSKSVSISWRVARVSHDLRIPEVSQTGEMQAVVLPQPGDEGTISARLKAHSNCGVHMDSVTAKGEIVVVYHGFHPKDEAFWETEEGMTFDRNRIEVVYAKDGGEWRITGIGSPGIHGEPAPG
ncbi:hypothetical protein HZ994_13905 [Akkermansiaceae bacterium]|nr:hypothetical protein HZ994_13905 [Akkermansiaceae bacterium]